MAKKRSFVDRLLNATEKVGNALPHPATLFLLFALSVLLFSFIAHIFNWSGIHPGTGEEIKVVNLLSKEGFHRIILELVDNYTGFAPLGIVLWPCWGLVSQRERVDRRTHQAVGPLGAAASAHLCAGLCRYRFKFCFRYWLCLTDPPGGHHLPGSRTASHHRNGCCLCRCFRWLLRQPAHWFH